MSSESSRGFCSDLVWRGRGLEFRVHTISDMGLLPRAWSFVCFSIIRLLILTCCPSFRALILLFLVSVEFCDLVGFGLLGEFGLGLLPLFMGSVPVVVDLKRPELFASSLLSLIWSSEVRWFQERMLHWWCHRFVRYCSGLEWFLSSYRLCE